MLKTNTIHLSGLNGLRAIAALSVVIYHVNQALGSFNLHTIYLGKYGNGMGLFYIMGPSAVTIFFALSGFLITYLLLLEKDKNDVSVGSFYMRRILRIWPLYYLYLIICITLIVALSWHISKTTLIYYVILAANIPFILFTHNPKKFPLPSLIAHYWSLAVEEQFYLIWPWFIKKIKTTKLIFWVTLIIAALITLKIIFRYTLPEGDTSIPYATLSVTRFQCMLIGGLGAILYFNKNKYLFKIACSKITQSLAWIFLFLLATNHHVADIIDDELISIVTVLLIVGQITITHRLINLEKNIFDFLGKISYGIYVIHPLVIFFLIKIFARFSFNNPIKYVLVFAAVISLTVFAAFLSYKYIEKRFLALKLKYSIIPSSSSKQE